MTTKTFFDYHYSTYNNPNSFPEPFRPKATLAEDVAKPMPNLEADGIWHMGPRPSNTVAGHMAEPMPNVEADGVWRSGRRAHWKSPVADSTKAEPSYLAERFWRIRWARYSRYNVIVRWLESVATM